MTLPADPAAAGDSPPPAGEGVVTGQLVQLDAVQPSAAQVNATRKAAKARSGQQLLAGSVFITILVWILRLNGIDLNPLDDVTDMPPEVANALGDVVTFGLVWIMNRPVEDDPPA